MPYIARNSTEFSDDRVEDEQFNVHRSDDFDDSPLVSSTSLAPLAGETGQEDRPVDTDARVEHSNNPGGRTVLEPERDEHRPSTTGEREEQYYTEDSQSSVSTEDEDEDDEDDSTLVEDVRVGNFQPGHDIRLSVVEINYEDMATPGLSVGTDEDDSNSEVASDYNSDEDEGPVAIDGSHSDFAINYDSDEDEGPLAIEDVEDGRPLVSYLGVIVPVYYRQKRTRPVLEEDDDDSASHGPVAGPSTTSPGPANASADVHHAPKRPRQSITPSSHIEQSNLAIQLRQSDFSEDYERERRPFPVRTVDAYASGSRSLDPPDHAILLGAGTPPPSPSSGRSPLYGYVVEYAYESEGGEGEYEEEYEYEQHDADDEREVEDVGQEHDNDLVTQLPVTVGEGEENDDDHGEDEEPVVDEF